MSHQLIDEFTTPQDTRNDSQVEIRWVLCLILICIMVVLVIVAIWFVLTSKRPGLRPSQKVIGDPSEKVDASRSTKKVRRTCSGPGPSTEGTCK